MRERETIIVRELAGMKSFENSICNQNSAPTLIIKNPAEAMDRKAIIDQRMRRRIFFSSFFSAISLTRCKNICPEKAKRGVIIN